MNDIEESIETQKCYNVGSDIFHVTEFGDHVQLGQNCQSLKPPGEGLEDPIKSPVLMQDEP